ARTSRTAATRSRSAMDTCAGRPSRHSLLSLMLAASLSPSTRSLICTSPLARSSPPWMTTQGAPRLSAYFICAFMPAVPRYISARLAGWRRGLVSFLQRGAYAGLAQRLGELLEARQRVLVHHQHDHGSIGGGALVLVDGGEGRLQAR